MDLRDFQRIFLQVFKYGIIGVASTLIQSVVFYILAMTVLGCLTADDIVVKIFGCGESDIADSVRAVRFAIATGIGFTFANVFCWLMNRVFVFTPGKFKWHVEFAMFFGVSALAMVLATIVSSALINWCGLMTSLAVLIEIMMSFALNFFARKFFIFKG
jgi:putative flippase GtrA